MYHYVRELSQTPFPKIKGLLVSEFKEQLYYLKRHYQFVTIEDCLQAIYSDKDLPSNAALLTFDDGYSDHYLNVFPLLSEFGIQGCFFPSAKAILKNKVLEVNKLQFILAAAPTLEELINKIFRLLNQYRSQYGLENNEYYFLKLAQKAPFDSKEVVFIKKLLQVELEKNLRSLILNELFAEYVTTDESMFSQELYMNTDQLKHMIREGMYIGSHGYNHDWLDSLPPDEQEKEVDLSLEFLNQLGLSIDRWVMCYPYGAYNASLLNILKKKGCQLALTTRLDITRLHKDNALTLERLDTNHLPKNANAKPNLYTQKILKV